MVASAILSELLKLPKDESAIFNNSIVLINSGNYGIPVSQLIFHAHPLGISIQIIVLISQNILTYTYRLYNLISATKSSLAILRELIKLPIIHALILGIIFNSFNIPIPAFLFVPLEHLSNAFLALAPLLLGAQLSQME